ncbi:MAG TPA: FHA domain-containing protein [Methylomirabilota bacterium]|nr:FHA domain-containing protein [Methylomirabilota bacterium]
MAKLVVLSEGHGGRTQEIVADKPTTVGRLEDNTFHLAEGSISSHHAEIFLRGSDVVVKDLNSTNGTYINGEKITEGVLKPGQILRLGSIELKLDGPAPAASASTPTKAKTRVIPGVQAKEFESGGRDVKFDKNNAFGKKRNKINTIFIVVGAVLGLIIIGFLVFTFMNMRSGS